MNITNKVKILCEDGCEQSIWCKQLLGGLQKELKKRRISYEQLTNGEQILPRDSVCVIGINNAWTEEQVRQCNQKDCVPIVLSNQSRRKVQGQYHLVCADIRSAVSKLQEAFGAAGRKRIALYGANYEADAEKDRTESFAKLIGDPSDIYRNTGNLETCFRSFKPKAALYDAVVCTNGYAAISLVKKLEKEMPELLEDLLILSCEEVLRHSKYNRWISLIDLDLESYGSTALAVLEMASMREEISVITIRMNARVCDIPEKRSNAALVSEETEAYADPEIISMEKIEQLLRDADDMDHHIIAMLLDHAKYSDIADSCYMTEGNVKYRVKKYMSICDCRTRKELEELLKEYLQ